MFGVTIAWVLFALLGVSGYSYCRTWTQKYRFGRMVLSGLENSDFGPVGKNEDTGITAGGHEDGGFYSFGPRSNKAPITEDAVVKLPSMREVERGYSEAKAAKARAAARLKTGPFSDKEDEIIRKMVTEWKGGRGQWAEIGKALNRSGQHCMYRWTQVLNPINSGSGPKISSDLY